MHRGVFVFQAMESLKRAVLSSTAAQPAMQRRASNMMAKTWLCSRWENNSYVRFLRTFDLYWRARKTKLPHDIVFKSDCKAMLTRQTFMLNSHLLLKSDFLCVAVQMFERGLSAHCDVDSSRSQSESYTKVNMSDITHGMFSTEANRAAGVEAKTESNTELIHQFGSGPNLV